LSKGFFPAPEEEKKGEMMDKKMDEMDKK